MTVQTELGRSNQSPTIVLPVLTDWSPIQTLPQSTFRLLLPFRVHLRTFPLFWSFGSQPTFNKDLT